MGLSKGGNGILDTLRGMWERGLQGGHMGMGQNGANGNCSGFGIRLPGLRPLVNLGC